MRFLEDAVTAQPSIEAAIKKFGYAAEHNYFWYTYYLDPGWRNIFVETDRGGLFTAYHDRKRTAYVSFDPLASLEQRVPLLLEYMAWMFEHTDAEKIWFQLETPRQKELLKILPDRYRANRTYFKLTWPVYDLREFDTTLPGGHYKSLRKEVHKFYREHQVSVQDAKTYEDRAALHAIVDDWKHKRPNQEHTSMQPYHNIIDGGFEGMKEARIFIVDGKAVGFNAGWMVPNHDRFCGAIGIHNYSLNDLGTMLYLEDLFWLKAHGYHEVDMEGSEKKALAFKNKFCLPKFTYETSHFSVVKRS
jgi:hypothetical protein